jgi:hypothetical protein
MISVVATLFFFYVVINALTAQVRSAHYNSWSTAPVVASALVAALLVDSDNLAAALPALFVAVQGAYSPATRTGRLSAPSTPGRNTDPVTGRVPSGAAVLRCVG